MSSTVELREVVSQLKKRGITPLSLEESGGYIEAQELRIAYGLLGDADWEGLDTKQTQESPKKKGKGWYPGKPETDEDWLAVAAKKLDAVGSQVKFDPIRSGKSRGLDIQSRLLGFGRSQTLPMCGCTLKVDNRGIETIHCLGNTDSCPYTNS